MIYGFGIVIAIISILSCTFDIYSLIIWPASYTPERILSMIKHYNSTRNTTVNRLTSGALHSQCSFLSTLEESSAWITVNPNDFRIQQAAMETYHSLHGEPGYREFPELVGMEAYMQAGSQLKVILGPEQQEVRELFTECIKGVIQSEPYLWIERDFQDQSAWLDHWYAVNDKTCYTFSHPADVTEDWIVAPRSYNLFNRSYVVHIQQGESRNVAKGVFVDPWHEISVCLVLDHQNVIVEASSAQIRVPAKICDKAAGNMQNLVGCNAFGLSKKDVAASVGGPEGCTHLLEIVYYVCRMSRIAL